MNLQALETSVSAKETGRPFAFGDGKLFIAQSGNIEHKKALRRLYEPHGKALAHGGTLEPQVAIEIDNQAMAEAVLVGWENMTKGDEPLPYSRENAFWVLSKVDVVRDFVLRIAEDKLQFTIAAVNAASETLKKS